MNQLYLLYTIMRFGLLVQAGLTKENPTVNFMDDYAEVVLQRNIESLYACGGMILCLYMYDIYIYIYMYTQLI